MQTAQLQAWSAQQQHHARVHTAVCGRHALRVRSLGHRDCGSINTGACPLIRNACCTCDLFEACITMHVPQCKCCRRSCDTIDRGQACNVGCAEQCSVVTGTPYTSTHAAPQACRLHRPPRFTQSQPAATLHLLHGCALFSHHAPSSLMEPPKKTVAACNASSIRTCSCPPTPLAHVFYRTVACTFAACGC